MYRVQGILALVLTALAGRALADPAPMSAGAQPAPTTSATIRIASETLRIDLSSRKAADVAVSLLLENGGPAGKLTVGFPCGVADLDCKTPIRVLLDGKPTRARRKGKAWVWPMAFAEKQSVALEIYYLAPLHNERYENPYMGMGALTYRLITGASWAGPIGELDIKVTMPTDAIIWTTPAGATRERGKVSWKLANHEPAGDVAIFFHPRFLGRRDGTPAERAAIARDLVAEKAEMTEWAHTLQRVIKRTLTLPEPADAEIADTIAASAKLYETP